MGLFSKVFSKKYTFIFVPDVTAKFIRFSLPRLVVKGGVAVALSFLLMLGWFSFTLFQKQQDLAQLEKLRSVTEEQALEIQQFAKKIQQFEKQIGRLEAWDKKLRVITALEPRSGPSQESNQKDIGGPEHTGIDFSSASDGYAITLLETLDRDLERVRQEASAQEASFFELDAFFKEQSSLLSHTPSVWPVRGMVTSTFGYRRSPFTGLREMHEGLDIATHMKSPIQTTANGIVIRSSYERGYGHLVEIDHGYGVVTRYGHNAKNLVKVGQKVKRGETIALVGNTGRSTGPHLHYEVLLNGVPVNPNRYFLEDF